MEQRFLIRTMYLYLFALLGLVLLTIGGVRLVTMVLRASIFTKADEEQRMIRVQPPSLLYSPGYMQRIQEGEGFSAEEKEHIRQALADYEDWKEHRGKIDPVTVRRHREASQSLAFILIGLPLYLWHWLIIRKEAENHHLTR